jgi:hypothetical protein
MSGLFIEMGFLTNFVPGLALNCNPPDLCLPLNHFSAHLLKADKNVTETLTRKRSTGCEQCHHTSKERCLIKGGGLSEGFK